MSEESGFGLNFAAKFLGLIILTTGILSLYFTVSTSQLMAYAGLFGFLSIILIALGLVLITAIIE
jgi:hypothetical protein